MGNEWLSRAIAALTEMGLRAEEAYPARTAYHLAGPLILVSLDRVDYGEQSVELKALVCSPVSQGGSTCRAAAERAGQALLGAGMECIQGSCQFDSSLDCYCIPLTARYVQPQQAEPEFRVKVANVLLENAVNFTVRQEESPQTEETPPGIYWNLQIEEVFLPGEPEPILADEPFAIEVTRKKSGETFESCSWTSIRSEDSLTQLRRIRTAVSASRQLAAL